MHRYIYVSSVIYNFLKILFEHDTTAITAPWTTTDKQSEHGEGRRGGYRRGE
jgi:hypothetical protein